MKRLSIIIGLALVMLTAACSKEATTDLNPSFKTIIGVDIECPDSRTYIGQPNVDGTYPVLWSEGDKVAVNGVEVAVDAKYVGTSRLKLEVAAAEEYKLAYPAENIKDELLTVSEVQKFVEGSFAVGSGVLVGYSQTEDIKLKNLYGYLKFSVTNAANVNRITVVAKGGESISGTFNIDYKGATISALAGKDIIRVTDVTATDGVATVVVAVPAGEYAEGFTVKIQDKSNGTMTKSLKGAGATVEAGVIYTMPQLSFAKSTTESLIMTANDFVDFIALVNGDAGYDKWVNSDGEVKLGADIDLTGVNLKQIKSFGGKFNGQGFALKNWKTTLPLFGEIVAGGVVKNLVIDSSCCLTPDMADANTHVGVIAGILRGLLDGCVNNSDITITGSLTNSAKRFGCVVASGYGRIRNCINNGDLICNFTAIDQAFYMGGIVGYYNPESGKGQGEEFMKDCINNGDIKIICDDEPSKAYIGGVLGSTTLSNQYETVDGKNVAKAVTCEGTIIRCYNNGEVYYEFRKLGSGTYTNVGGVVGYAQAVILDCENRGKVSFITPIDSETAATRPAVGGVVASTIFSLNNCINRGEVFVEGTWASAGTAGYQGTGGQVQPNFGGVVGSVGHYSIVGSNTLDNCINYGKLTFKPRIIPTAGTRQYFGGVAGFSSVNVSNCQNYGEMTIFGNGLYVYSGAVVGLTHEGCTTTNCTNHGSFSFTHDLEGSVKAGVLDGSDKVKSFFGGVVAYAQGVVMNCHNYGVGEMYSNSRNLNGGAVVGYADSSSPISNCSNSAALTCYIDNIVNALPDYTGSAPYHYVGGVVGDGAGNMDNVTNDEKASLTVYTNVAGDFGGVVGYAAGNNLILVNKAPVSIDFTYKNQTCAAQSMIGGVVAKNYAKDENNKVTVDGCSNSGAITVKNLAYTNNYAYVGGIIGSNAAGVGSIKNNVSSGNIEFDCPSAVRLGGVAGYTVCKLTDSSFTGKITARRLYASSSYFGSIGGLIGYTAQGIIGGSVDCTIDAQGDAGIMVGGVMGCTGPDTWTGITVKADVSTSTGAYYGLLVGGATGQYTVNLGNASSPINIRKSSKLQGVTIKGDGTDALSGIPDKAVCKVVKVVYIN